MKKQKPKKWGSRQQREEWRQELNAFGPRKRHTNIPLKEQFGSIWPRAKSGFAKDMFKAGYFGALLHNSTGWQNIHMWCKDNFEQYSWNGSLFWFQTKEDRERFMRKYESTIFTGFGKD